LKHLPNSLTALIKISINRYLGLDPDAKSRLKPLAGKILKVEIKELGLPFYLEFHPQAVSVLHSCDKPPDASIATSIPVLVKLSLSSQGATQVLAEKIDMTGDIEIGKEFQKLIMDVNIDWEEILSHYTGDLVAHQVGRQIGFFRDWLKSTSNTLMTDLSEYLREEAGILPSKQEVQYYINAVDDIRMTVDRSTARLKFLQDAISAHNTDYDDSNNNKAN